MKLTEKELNEFPIGTKIYTGYGKKYMKLDNSPAEWREMKDNYWMSSGGLLNSSIKQIEIPTYTEYIPPKPILDEKEKEYLSAVIKPWENRIKSIAKHHYKGEEYVYFYCSGIGNSFGLPYFSEGTMYKGMELDKEYTLEELGL